MDRHIFCILIAQLNIETDQAELPALSDSQKSLIQNAVIPIFLSENSNSAIRQLENLIQNTNIREIRLYSTDFQLVAETVNGSAPELAKQTHTDSIPIVFQGSLAGSAQLSIAHTEAEPQLFKNGLTIVFKSLVIVLLGWIVSLSYTYVLAKVLPQFRMKKRSLKVLSPDDSTPQSAESSLLLYLYLEPDAILAKDSTIHKSCIQSFYKNLESHVRIYGGRIVSISEQRIICRMASTETTNDQQLALTFCWGIAGPLLYKSEGNQYHLNVKSLLHKTKVLAKSGKLYSAISEINADLERAIKKSPQDAHLSQQFLSSLASTDFDHKKSKDHAELHRVLSVKKSLDSLWKKQEILVASTTSG